MRKNYNSPDSERGPSSRNRSGFRRPAAFREPTPPPDDHDEPQSKRHSGFREDRKPFAARETMKPDQFEPEMELAATFADCIVDAGKSLRPTDSVPRRSLEALAEFDYNGECAVKQRALELFWEKNRLSGKIEPLIQSPLPRGYRTTSKRRASFSQGRLSLHIERLHDLSEPSQLEPEMHHRIYQMLAEILAPSHFQALTRNLNYCIIRGSYARCAVILNVCAINGDIVRKLKQLSEEIQARESAVISCFMYLDETRSDYYLESRRPEKGVAFKKMFGPEFLDITVDSIRMLYPPTVFSQVNESILPQFTAAFRTLLHFTPETRLLDLYCGYGLLGLTAAPHVGSVFGMDIEGPAIKAAAANAAHLFKGRQLKFAAAAITAESLRQKLPPPSERDVVILDPPRHGTAPGVIETIAARKAARVLHIFCGADEIPREMKIWRANGYIPMRVVPLDMFPGSANLETLVLLEPEKRGKK